MSGRSCSDARTVFFNGEAELLHRPPDGGETRRRAQGVFELRQRPIRLCWISAASVCKWGASMTHRRPQFLDPAHTNVIDHTDAEPDYPGRIAATGNL